MKRYQIWAVVLIMLTISVGSQAVLAQAANGHKVTMQEEAKVAVVNSLCPIMGTEIDSKNVPADLTRDFMEQKVGFCCTSCLAKWDKLSSAEKGEKLAAVKDKM